MSDFSMVDLFRVEVENQLLTFTEALLELEKQGSNPRNLEAMMRAAHSIKGAARLVGVKPAERLAHVMEDCFSAAQQGTIEVTSASTDLFLAASDLLRQISLQPEGQFDAFVQQNPQSFEDMLSRLAAVAQGQTPSPPVTPAPRPEIAAPVAPEETAPPIGIAL